MNVLSLFDGISAGMLALQRVGIKVDKYYASEIEPNAIAVSKRNFPNIIQLGDVTKWREWNIELNKIDFLISTLINGLTKPSVDLIKSMFHSNIVKYLVHT